MKKIVAWGQVGIGPTGEEVAISGPPSSKAKSSSHEELDIEALRRLLNNAAEAIGTSAAKFCINQH